MRFGMKGTWWCILISVGEPPILLLRTTRRNRKAQIAVLGFCIADSPTEMSIHKVL